MSDELNNSSEHQDILDRDNKFSIKDTKVIIGTSLLAAAIGIAIFILKITDPVTVPPAKPTLKPLSMDGNMLADDQYEKFRAETTSLHDLGKNHEQELSEMRKELEALKLQLKEGKTVPKSDLLQEIDKVKQQGKLNIEGASNEKPMFSYPDPPTHTQSPAKRFVQQTMANAEKEELIGGVTKVAGIQYIKKEKKKGSRHYLPPGFMKASLLTGIDALTSKEGKQDVESIFFRISTPAVLPNAVKQNLTGCFVVANANGNLAKERVQVRAINLSCMSADGSTYVDEKILGFVSDESDGKRDLVGNVVNRQGSQMSWLLAASFIGELGNSASLSAFDTNQNVLGTSTTLDPSKTVTRSLGAGVQDASQSYKGIILDYLKQAGPVVEMGPGKEATLFLQEGVWLNVMETEAENNAA